MTNDKVDLKVTIGLFSKFIKKIDDINARNSNGETPIFIACNTNQSKVGWYPGVVTKDLELKSHSLLLTLLHSGADPHIKNSNGKNAFDVATDLDRQTMLKYLGIKNHMSAIPEEINVGIDSEVKII